MKLQRYFKKSALIAISLLFLLSTLIITGYENFIQHRNTVIRQQQEHLLTIAKSVSRSIDAYINDKVDSLAVLAQNPRISEAYGYHEEVIKGFYNEFGDDMTAVMLLDKNGSFVYEYPERNTRKKIDPAVLSYVIKNKKACVTKEYKSGVNQFSIDILQPVVKNRELRGILVSTVDLNSLYDSLIYPIRPGKMGYAMVKNSDCIIIMHPVIEQVGLEALKDRQQKFPKYNWNELEELYKKQVEEGEGYHVYHSNWWQDNGLKWSKKINAYTTIKISNISWIISVQMDYAEIEQPIRGALINISLIAVIIVIIILLVAYIIFKIDKKRKALELETRYLKELNKTWEELIKSEAKLRHSQKLQTIGTLTSGIAHEFNNLLTPILGYSEILQNNADCTEDMREDIVEISKSASRAKEIIEQILVFSRNDNVAAIAEPVRIDYIVQESTKLIKSILPSSIRLVENISSSDTVLGSPTQLQQVLLNLCTNAYHAMKENGGILEINADAYSVGDTESIEMNMARGKYVKIQVKDTGTGMDEETLSQIFDPFFTTKKTGEGTGLGLSVVHGIVKNHKGRIFASSQLNVGTTIDIYLPAAEEAAAEDEKEARTAALSSGSILVIDDNLGVLKLLEKGLCKYGYGVIVESDGYKAMKLLENSPAAFEVIVLDYNMPNISGIEIARYAKQRNSNVKIILISGYVKEDIASNYSDIFDDYMLKPIAVPELVKKINALQHKYQ